MSLTYSNYSDTEFKVEYSEKLFGTESNVSLELDGEVGIII